MTHIPRTRRWPSVPGSNSADMSPVAGWPSFRRIVPIPFGAWMAALDRWQLTGPGGELRLGRSALRDPSPPAVPVTRRDP